MNKEEFEIKKEDPDLLWFKETMNIKSDPFQEWINLRLREESFAQRIFKCVKVN